MPKPTYRVTNRVSGFLKEIYFYTHDNFGQYQADAYAAGLIGAFELLTKFPKMGQSADEYKHGLRRYRHKSHVIFYSVDGETIVIEYMSHIRADVRKHMFDED